MDNNQKKREALLTTVMNLFSETFRNKAILHGGMVLRLLECPRFTNDLDYLFVPFKSKNDVQEMILGALKTIPGLKLSYSMNSKCLRILLKSAENVTAQVEVKVDMECKTDVLTSAPLSRIYNQPARVIAVIDFGTALANKMSAWLDRRLMRDLYDIHHFFLQGLRYDAAVIRERRGVAALDFFRQLVVFVEDNVTQTTIDQDINMLLPDEKFQRLRKVIKPEVLLFLKDEAGRLAG